MRSRVRLNWMLSALALCASAAAAAPPKQVLLTREMQDFYRVSPGTFFIKTTGCTEQVFGDRADLRVTVGIKGGTLLFRSGRTCTVEKFLREVGASELTGGSIF